MTICRIFGSLNGVREQFQISIPIVSFSLNQRSQNNSFGNPFLAGIELGCNVFVVHQDSIISFMDQYIECHDEATYRNPNKTTILLTDGTQSREPNLLDELGKHPSLVEIMNLLILKPTANMEAIELWTHRFAGTVEESTDLLLLDIFDIASKTFRRGKQLFPDKTSNLQGKFIRLATFSIPPLVVLRESEQSEPLIKSENQIYELDGCDGLLMVEYCRRYNCSVELVLDEANMWGRILPNKTGIGVLGSLAERRADIGLGAMVSWYDPLKYLTFSKPMQRGRITCFAPKPMLQPSWRAMLLTFSVPVWISTIVVFIIIVFLHILMDRLNQAKINHQNIARSFLNLFAIFLLQAAAIRRRNVSDVMLSVALLMFTFNVVHIYSSRNASLRTIPLFGPSIETLDDLARSGLTILQAHEAWMFSLILSKNPTIKKLVSKFQAQPPSVLRELADQGNVAFIIAETNNGNLMLGEWITAGNVHQYQVMKENLYYEYEIFMATKTWPLMIPFSTLAARTVEAKMRQYQEQDGIYKYSDYYVQTTARKSHLRQPNAPRNLNLTDLVGGFFTLGFGVLVAIIVFAVEISLIKTKRIMQRYVSKRTMLLQK